MSTGREDIRIGTGPGSIRSLVLEIEDPINRIHGIVRALCGIYHVLGPDDAADETPVKLSHALQSEVERLTDFWNRLARQCGIKVPDDHKPAPADGLDVRRMKQLAELGINLNLGAMVAADNAAGDGMVSPDVPLKLAREVDSIFYKLTNLLDGRPEDGS